MNNILLFHLFDSPSNIFELIFICLIIIKIDLQMKKNIDSLIGPWIPWQLLTNDLYRSSNDHLFIFRRTHWYSHLISIKWQIFLLICHSTIHRLFLFGIWSEKRLTSHSISVHYWSRQIAKDILLKIDQYENAFLCEDVDVCILSVDMFCLMCSIVCKRRNEM